MGNLSVTTSNERSITTAPGHESSRTPASLAELSAPRSDDRGAIRTAVAGAAADVPTGEANVSDEQLVPGTKVNGHQLFVRDGHRFYYPNGDTKSNFVSVQQPDGSFKWTTKDAMLTPNGNNFRGNQPHQIGSVETLNGKLAAMYTFPDGSKAYFDGSDWHQQQRGTDTFKTIAGPRLSYRGGGGVEVIYAAPSSALAPRI